MKKIILSITLMFVTLLNADRLFGVTYTVIVGAAGSLTFTPSNLNIKLGDTITWKWDNGIHTTTSDVNGIPNGALPWHEEIDGAHPSYIYVPTMPGVYYYHSKPPFGPGMPGSFTVTSVANELSATNLTITPNPAANMAHIHTNASKSSILIIYNIIGVPVTSYNVYQQSPNDIYLDVSNLPMGIYLVKLIIGNATATQKLIVAR